MFGLSIGVVGTGDSGWTTGVAPSSGGGSNWSTVAAPSSSSGGSTVAALSSGSGGVANPIAVPYGEGVYTPLNYPALRFLQEGERLNDQTIRQSDQSNLKTLALVALALFAVHKL